MLTALEAAAAIAAPAIPILNEVSAVVTAVTILIKVLPYIENGAVMIYKETLIIAPKVDADFLKVVALVHEL